MEKEGCQPSTAWMMAGCEGGLCAPLQEGLAGCMEAGLERRRLKPCWDQVTVVSFLESASTNAKGPGELALVI